MLTTCSIPRAVLSCAVVSLMAAAGAPSHANGLDPVLLEQPFLDGGSSVLTNPGAGYENAESFALPGNAVITAISWWGTEADLTGWSVRLAGSLPSLAESTSLLSGSVNRSSALGLDDMARDIFRYDLVLSGLAATTQPYYLSIAYQDVDWYWTASADGDGVSHFSESYDSSNLPVWATAAPDLSFQIHGTRVAEAPEPGLLGLLGLAGGLGGWSLRRQRRAVGRASS